MISYVPTGQAHNTYAHVVVGKFTMPYQTIVESMYPNMSAQYRGLVAEILENTEPRGSEDTLAYKWDNVISHTFKEYSCAVDEPDKDVDFSKRRSANEEKQNSLKTR